MAANASPAPLLTPKLFVPPPRPGQIARPHLVARLHAAAAHPLTLLSAPAGYGKTTLLSAWVTQAEQPVAWLTLDRADNDPARFLRYLAAALRPIDPRLGHALPGDAGEGAVAALVDAILDAGVEFVLVLDDFHLLDDPHVLTWVQTLVSHQPPPLHLVIATREDPPLPLARLRSQGRLHELRAHDLRFSPDEAAHLLNENMGLALPPDALHALDTRMEGWVAGLQLAALSLAHAPDPAALIHGLSGNHHYILGYLTEEVLRHLPPDQQTFLLETSILPRLTAPLCDAVTGRQDSAALLDQLRRANAFVLPLDDEFRWLRYHPLFADLLRAQLRQSRAAHIPTLHRRAAAWCAAQELAADAIDHALAAEDYAQAVTWLEEHARSVVLQGYARTVESWLQRLPQPWQQAGPRANLAFAWSLLLRGQLALLPAYLERAEAAAANLDTTAATSLRAECLALRAALVSLRGEVDRACDLAAQAVDLAPAADVYVQGMTRFALGTAYNYAGRVAAAVDAYTAARPYCDTSGNTVAALLTVANLAVLEIMRGRLHAAAARCRPILAHAATTPDFRPPPLATVYGAYGEVLYLRNDLDAAQTQILHSAELSKPGGHVAALAYGAVMQARLALAQGDMAEADAALATITPLLARGLPAWVSGHVIHQQVIVALARGDLLAAQAALAAAGVPLDAPPTYATELLHLAHVRILLAAGRDHPPALRQGLALARQLLPPAEAAGRLGRVLEMRLLAAQLHDAAGEAAAAQTDLTAALTLAAPEGAIRPLLNAGAPLAALLARLSPPPDLAPFVARVLAAFPATETSPPLDQTGLVEPLTDRELDVLRLLATGMTYEQMAQELIVSVNTVRYHVKGVYGKLGVNGRTAALAQAHIRHLL